MSETGPSLLVQHKDLYTKRRFKLCAYQGVQWDLSHLGPFAFREEIEPQLWVDVVVFFSSHCFTRGYKTWEDRGIPDEHRYWDANVLRVLDPHRFELSKKFMPALAQQLKERHIRVLGAPHHNFATFEGSEEDGVSFLYAVFFSVRKDRSRSKRLIMHIDSAYPIPALSNNQKKSKKVNLRTLLKTVYKGKAIKP